MTFPGGDVLEELPDGIVGCALEVSGNIDRSDGAQQIARLHELAAFGYICGMNAMVTKQKYRSTILLSKWFENHDCESCANARGAMKK